MSAEQRSECLRLRKDKKSSTAAAVNSETEKLRRRVASLESEIKEKSRDRKSRLQIPDFVPVRNHDFQVPVFFDGSSLRHFPESANLHDPPTAKRA